MVFPFLSPTDVSGGGAGHVSGHLCQSLQKGQSQKILFLKKLRSANGNLKEVDFNVQVAVSHITCRTKLKRS